MIEHEINRLKSSSSSIVLLSVFLLSFQYLIAVQAKPYPSYQQQRLLLLSFGGFRYDFIENYNLKNLGEFSVESSRAAYLNPQFTTQAFPNHWSIATGAYAETHGIVANKFFDPQYNDYFQEQNKELKWWNETEPFWFKSVRKGKFSN